ncbi:hypothetical protein ASC77_09415 [Nocardioides sp. Root1257]|uniref:ATP-binding protein n=1 Tax=unclassified Nocardioides TaxID=2615069 RepID=UPI0006F77C50|nr:MULTISPECIES: ATP-binding protein [unclassified Nocardioides]KQW48927.1 hypothetical protein ASC77_09415 [Nocardioides sp. Root1257]KRC48102.1 hypothetical protein ASE24_09420 [Nocardioides sp. Root224]
MSADAVRAGVVAAIVRRLDASGYLGSAGGWLAEQVPAAPEGEPVGLGRLTDVEARLVVAAGLIEEDIRFGALFASLQEPLAARRPCIGLLAWLLCEPDETPAELTALCHDLVRRGLLSVDNPTDPRSEWVLRVPVPVWDLVSTGRVQPASLPPQVTLRSDFPKPDELALSPGAAGAVASLPDLIAEDRLSAVLVRGMSGSGRTSVLGSVAAESGQDVLQYDGDVADPAWQVFAALASVADVLPVLRCTPGPGETVTVPALPGLAGPLGVVCGRTGSVAGPQLARVLAITLDAVGPDDRRLLWGTAGLDDRADDLDEIVERFLLPPGNILRAAPLAALNARAAGRDGIGTADVRAATRTMRRQELDTLATRLDPLELAGGPVLTPSAGAELDTLLSRCRHREHLVLHSAGGHGGLNRGVRALFAGPSGTGKTLTARHLAAVLDLDLYRVDLAAVVNKYIGETERNLDRVLSRAEELDVLLLLDEGDALMARRTDVSNANDRYANLETNFLLQRLETFDGIVIVTSNAAGRIDPAFLRRIDVTVDFVPPDAEQRWQIWSEHLPLEHEVPADLLTEVSRRCPLTGGQIRNAALHALLLALDREEPVCSADLLDAVRREYRRTGATYPLEGLTPTSAPRRSTPTW